VIHPVPAGDLTFVKASHKSMYGTIATSWKRDAAHFTLEVTIPPNTSALVTIPAKDPAAVTESGHSVKYLRIEPGGAATYEVPSGTYTFASTL
jgi:alpha-L-rhamnosidase